MKITKDFSIDLFSKYRTEIYGFCILWIMFFHSFIVGVKFFPNVPILKYLGSFISYGKYGVDVFLFISGICLYYSFSKCSDLNIYLSKRLKRIFYPVFIIAIPFWIYWYFAYDMNLGRLFIKASMSGFPLAGYTQVWYVSFILICYLFYPYIYNLFFKNDKTNYRNYVILMILSLVFCFSAWKGEPGRYNANEIAYTRIPVFLTGCILGKACKEKKKAPVLFILTMIFAVVISYYAEYTDKIDEFQRIYRRLFCITAIGYAFVFGMLLDIIKCNIVNRFFAFFGKMSLQLYLSHVLAITFYLKTSFYEKGNTLNYVILLLAATVVAFCAYHIQELIEKAFLKKAVV